MSTETAVSTCTAAASMARPMPHARFDGELAAYELRFRSLFSEGRAIAVPCDACGHVAIDQLTERLRNAYFGARKLVGAEYAFPVLTRTH
jgi:hypothetical protein